MGHKHRIVHVKTQAPSQTEEQLWGGPGPDALPPTALPETAIIPPIVAIEPLMGCNASCVMCPVHAVSRPRGSMKMDVYAEIVNQICALPQQPTVVLNVLGEPLMDKQLERRIGLLKDRGIASVGFNSNFSLMTPERARSILSSGIDFIEMSIESLQADVYERIRVGLSLKEVLANMLDFIRIRDEMGARTVVRPLFIEQPDNQEERDAFIAFFKQHINHALGDQVRIIRRHNYGGYCESETPPQATSCGLIWNIMIIFNDGKVGLCCGDMDNTYSIGNVLEEGIIGAFNNHRFRYARMLHARGERTRMPLCAACNIPDVDNIYL